MLAGVAFLYVSGDLHGGEAPTAYPIIANGPNFEKFRSGQPFVPLRFVDGLPNGPQAYDGSAPIPFTRNTCLAVGTNAVPESYVIPKNDNAGDDPRARYGIATA